jgi:hypothetical protein
VGTVVSFAEESCWDGERFRSVRREIVFVVAGFAISPGKSIRGEFRADFGLWYDLDDDLLIQILVRDIPSVDWGWFIYHKKIDHSAILIYHPETGKVVGSIYPRGKTRQKLSCENNGANVVPISYGEECRARRIKREKDRAKKRLSDHSPEDC